MWKVSSFIVCENVQTITEKIDNGEIIQKPQIMNPIDTISMFSLPGYFTFSIFGNITDIDLECDNATIHVKIYLPDGSEYFRSKELPLPAFDVSNSSLKFSYDLRNFTFREIGAYTVKLFIKDDIFAETQFIVEKRSD